MEKKDHSIIIQKGLAVILASFVAFIAVISYSHAASISFYPDSVIKNVGDTFSLSVLVSSTEAMNATNLVVNFPEDLITLKNISKNGSILDFYPYEPSFSNNTGDINIEGVVFNPGFSGKLGRLLTFDFVAKKMGVGDISVEDIIVYANDGLATELSTTSSTSRVEIITPEPLPLPEPEFEIVTEPTNKPLPDPELTPDSEALLEPTSVPIYDPVPGKQEKIPELEPIETFEANIGETGNAPVCKSDMLLLAIFIILVIIVILLLVLFYEIIHERKQRKRNES